MSSRGPPYLFFQAQNDKHGQNREQITIVSSKTGLNVQREGGLGLYKMAPHLTNYYFSLFLRCQMYSVHCFWGWSPRKSDQRDYVAHSILIEKRKQILKHLMVVVMLVVLLLLRHSTAPRVEVLKMLLLAVLYPRTHNIPTTTIQIHHAADCRCCVRH